MRKSSSPTAYTAQLPEAQSQPFIILPDNASDPSQIEHKARLLSDTNRKQQKADRT